MDLFEILEEQSIVGFTGKINILNEVTSELIATIILIDGKLSNCFFKRHEASKALMNVLFELSEFPNRRIVVEPELISPVIFKIPLSISQVKKKSSEVIRQFKESQGQKPGDNIKLVIKPDFFKSGIEVDQNEFSLLCTMSDYSLVKDIYQYNEMMDYEITNSLVSLRKKEALKVVETK